MIFAMPGRYPEVPEIFQLVQTLWNRALPTTGEEFLTLEEQALSVGRQVADVLIAGFLRRVHEQPALVAEHVQAARAQSATALRTDRERPVTVTLASGGTVTLSTPYLVEERRGRVGRRRGHGRRGKGGSGQYPVLAGLGIEARATPYVRREAARQVVLTGSYSEATEQLSRQGIELDQKRVVNLAVRTGEALLALRESELELISLWEAEQESPLSGKRVMVGLDGGRVKTRRNNRRGRKTAKGRTGFTVEWREPKGFIIEILDEKGHAERHELPWIDMTMADADGVVRLLSSYLRALGASQAAELVFVSDGADWIWDRLPILIEEVGLDPSRVVKVLDFYHACEHLNEASELCSGLSAKDRKKLYKRWKGLLWEGKTGALLTELQGRARGRRAKKMKRVIAYFGNRLPLLDYPAVRAKELPIGSGAMESAIRRVVNLRFKGPGIMWKQAHLEPLLHLRAWLKAGRLDEAFSRLLKDNSYSPDLTEELMEEAA